MRRFLTLALSLLALLLLLTLAASAEATVTLVEGESTSTLTGDVLPTSTPPAGKVFVGWYADSSTGLSTVFLPAGAAIQADVTTYHALYIGMTVRNGAELRVVEGSEGLRFITDVDKADFSLLQSKGRVVGYGTIIAPKSYVQKTVGNKLTPEALAEKGYTKYLDAVSGGAYSEDEDSFAIAGSVSAVRNENGYMEFCAAGYLVVKYSDGTRARIYAAPNYKKAQRLYPLVMTAYSDRTTAADETHVNETDYGFSPYSDGNLEFMKGVLDSAVNIFYVKDPKDSKSEIAVVYPNTPAYEAPFEAVYDGKLFTLTVREGVDYSFKTDCYILIVGGSSVAPSKATISADGKVMTYKLSSHTPNY